MICSVTPRAYEYEFQEHDITKTWNYLHEHFGFNLKAWKKRFEEYKEKQHQVRDEVGNFQRFGKKFIEPVLNEILGRNVLYPTFNYLMQYIVTGKKQN
jgi:hypothetical protein